LTIDDGKKSLAMRKMVQKFRKKNGKLGEKLINIQIKKIKKWKKMKILGKNEKK